ncbi:YitT family protein [Marmoricola sp. URHB0036]|uniref:membrane protein YczE n=1 Tax=Marmoricola sp. URHB0036 TaxID=1298863 RepID=UPI0004000DCE|nr:membrane protein [Marmoricola sp. URHB0036]
MTSDVSLETLGDAAPRRVRELARLGPVAQLRAGRLPRRLSQLALGLALYGLTLGMMIRATLGNAPWDVLHQGMAIHLPISIGQAVIVMSLVVLLFWIPLRELPGLGTVANSFAVGLTADLTLSLLDAPEALWERSLLMVGGIVLNALATALYIGSQFGPGPRDGLMTGLHRRTGLSIRTVRTGLEVGVVAIGWLLGGVVGIGTVLYALAIGPLVQVMLPRCIVELPTEAPVARRDTTDKNHAE